MSYSMNMRILTASICLAGTLATWAMPIHARTEPVAPVAHTEPSATTQPSAKIVPIVPSEKVEPSEKIEPTKKTAPSAHISPSVEAFIAKLDSATRAIHQDAKKDPALIREGCRDLLNEILDFEAMAQATNVEIWEKMTPAQRDTFRSAFEQRMIGSCARQLAGYEGESLQLAGVRTAQGGDLLATIRIGAQDDGKLVTWRLHGSRPDSMRAVDVITEGRSAVLDARNEFAAVLQSVNGDIEALIAFMRK